jgi:hypothetical protein
MDKRHYNKWLDLIMSGVVIFGLALAHGVAFGRGHAAAFLSGVVVGAFTLITLEARSRPKRVEEEDG